MERLLADAEKLTGVHYDISSYADVTEAIHAIQVEMNVAGKTAEEASGTIEGSVNSMKAAWQNWLTGLADPNADLSALTDQLVDAVVTAARNVIPRMAVIVKELIAALPGLLGEVAAALPQIISETIGAVFGEEAGAMALDAVNGAVEAMAPLMEAVSSVIAMASEGMSAVMALAQELLPHMQPLFDLIAGVADILTQYVMPFITELLGSVLVVYIESIVGTVMALIAAVGDLVSFVTTAPESIMSFFSDLDSFLTGTFENAASSVVYAWDSVIEFFAGIPDRIVGFFQGIGDAISSLLSNIKLPHFKITGSINPLDWPSQGLPGIRVDWYGDGAYFDGPQVIGIGEEGPEAAMPLSPNKLKPIGDAIAASVFGDGIGEVLGVLREIRDKDSNVYLDREKVAVGIVGPTDRRLGNRQVLASRGVAAWA